MQNITETVPLADSDTVVAGRASSKMPGATLNLSPMHDMRQADALLAGKARETKLTSKKKINIDVMLGLLKGHF